jgi:Domain of unknown function (DUF4123)
MVFDAEPNRQSPAKVQAAFLKSDAVPKESQSARLHKLLFAADDRERFVYAILEAGVSVKAVTSELVAALEDYDPPQWRSLLRIQDDAELAHLATYLIELEPEHSDPYAKEAELTHFTQWLLSHPDLPRWGFFAVSSRPFEEVLSHISRFAVVELDNGANAFFRFAHPPYFMSLLSSMEESEIKDMGDYLERVFLFDKGNGDRFQSIAFSGNHYVKTDLAAESAFSETKR